MTKFDDILNFLMPILVFGFIIWIFYRIPLVKKGVDSLIEKIRGVRERSGGYGESKKINSISYE